MVVGRSGMRALSTAPNVATATTANKRKRAHTHTPHKHSDTPLGDVYIRNGSHVRCHGSLGEKCACAPAIASAYAHSSAFSV